MRQQDTDLFQQARKALDDKDYPRAMALFADITRAEGVSSATIYNAACALALAGESTAAFGYLARAVRAGFRDAELLGRDSDLVSLRSDPRWSRVVGWVRDADATYRAERSDPRVIQLVTSDIPLFWRAYDLAQAAPSAERPAVYTREYLTKGSIGLRDWQKVRSVNGRRLATYIDKHPKFFMSVRDETLRIQGQMDQVRRDFARLKALYPATVMPDTYFCLGPFAGGGTVSEAGLLLSAEMVAHTKTTFLGELSSWERSVITNTSDIPPLIAHEAIHFQQDFKTLDSTLLRRCLQEGSADFISHLSAGRMLKRTHEQHHWCDAHEKNLWDEFQKEMKGFDSSRWLYSGSEKGERPVDTGYYMGYVISKSYFDNHRDKKQAIYDILHVSNSSKFLEDSKYAEKKKR
jgi:hypothetical protein